MLEKMLCAGILSLFSPTLYQVGSSVSLFDLGPPPPSSSSSSRILTFSASLVEVTLGE